MQKNPELEDMMMPYERGVFAGKRMDEIPPRIILEMYYTDHFVGMPRMWVVQELQRLQNECDWTEDDRVQIRITRKLTPYNG